MRSRYQPNNNLMAYTTASQCTFVPELSTDKTEKYTEQVSNAEVAFFYPEDISIILMQGKNLVPRAVYAIVGENEIPSMVLVATELDSSGNIVRHLVEDNHVVALGCFPFNREGGTFEIIPQVANPGDNPTYDPTI